MKRGDEYEIGDVVQHGSFEDKVLATWCEHDNSDLIYLVTGSSWKYLTIYAVDRKARIGPRLARYVPMQLFLDLDEDMRIRAAQAPRKRKKKSKRSSRETSEDKKPDVEGRRRVPPKVTAAPAKEKEETPPLRRRIQRRKRGV